MVEFIVRANENLNDYVHIPRLLRTPTAYTARPDRFTTREKPMIPDGRKVFKNPKKERENDYVYRSIGTAIIPISRARHLSGLITLFRKAS